MAQSGQTQPHNPANPPRFHSPIEDPSTPYYLHPSEGPGLQLVSHQLRSDNYASWSRAIIIALTIKNKLGFIDGSIPTPPATEPIQLNAWIRNSTMVFSWILNSVSKEIQSSVLYFTSAKEIWDELKIRFQQSNGPQLFQLRRTLANLSQNEQNVVDYYTRVKSIWDELSTFRPSCTCGICHCLGSQNLSTYFENECVMNFLMGLNESNFGNSFSNLGFSGGFLIGRTLAVLLTMTRGTSMAARQGPVAMAAHQICLQVWLAVSLLTDAFASSAQALIASYISNDDYRTVKDIYHPERQF